jgi:hypothetical protein
MNESQLIVWVVLGDLGWRSHQPAPHALASAPSARRSRRADAARGNPQQTELSSLKERASRYRNPRAPPVELRESKS